MNLKLGLFLAVSIGMIVMLMAGMPGGVFGFGAVALLLVFAVVAGH